MGLDLIPLLNALSPWDGYLIFLSLSFPIYIMGMIAGFFPEASEDEMRQSL